MSLKLDYEFLFVGRDENSFLENYSCDFLQEYGEKSGQIFANIEIKNNPVDAEDIAVNIYDTMQKVFFDDMTASAYERFEATLKAINLKLKEFELKKDSRFIGELNVIICASVQGELLMSQTGESEAYLIRKRYVSTITEGLNDNKDNEDYFTNIASGSVEAGDFILLTNTRILRYISKTDLSACVRRSNVTDTLMEIRDVLSTEMLGRLSLTGVLVSTAKEVTIMEAENDYLEEESSVEETVLKDDGEPQIRMVEEESIVQNSRPTHLLRKDSKVKELLYKARDAAFSGGNSKNKILIALISVIVILVVSIFLANGLSDKQTKLNNFENILTGVQAKITEAETKGTYDKEGASQILDKAYTEAFSVSNSGYYREKANLYLLQITDTRDKLDNVTRISEGNVYMDLTKNDPAVNVLGMVEVSGKRYLYTENKLYEIILDVVSEPINLDPAETVVAATGFDDRGSIVLLTKSGKLMEYKEGTLSFMDTDDGSFRKGVAIDDWSNRLYLLDAVEGQIWKYPYKGSSEKFGVAEPYFATALDTMKYAKDFVIDSNIYVIDKDSKIVRYYGGEKSDLTIVNEPFNGFKTAEKIYTNENISQLFVLDDKANRLFVFDKDNTKGKLTYSTQYLFDYEIALRDVFTDKESGKIYLVTDKNILEM